MKKILLPIMAVLLSATAFSAANAADRTATTTYKTTSYHSETYYNWNPFSAQTTGLYVAGAAGGSFPDDNLDDSGVYSVSLGWQFHPMVRAELEAAYRDNDLDGARAGDAETYTYMLNAFWDIKNDTRFTPYLGVGAGWAYQKLDATDVSESENNFVYQGIAGVSFNIDNNWALTADYRYVDALNFDYSTVNADYSAHEVKGGLRYTF
ncbi:MAG: rane protein [Alphaproteobacteria bacterium]|nr:rane protein [Alphaproteobacteria bacterium]